MSTKANHVSQLQVAAEIGSMWRGTSYSSAAKSTGITTQQQQQKQQQCKSATLLLHPNPDSTCLASPARSLQTQAWKPSQERRASSWQPAASPIGGSAASSNWLCSTVMVHPSIGHLNVVNNCCLHAAAQSRAARAKRRTGKHFLDSERGTPASSGFSTRGERISLSFRLAQRP